MELAVVSVSPTFERHLSQVLPAGVRLRLFRSVDECLAAPRADTTVIVLHASSVDEALLEEAAGRLAADGRAPVAIASDEPGVGELLRLAPLGIRAYFNSYMADVHYQHMLHTLADGQSWFAPQLLNEMVLLVQSMQGGEKQDSELLEPLTSREKEVALCVCDGLNNREIAERFGITERTVKAHLTNIYQKLQVTDRLALASRLLRKPAASFH